MVPPDTQQLGALNLYPCRSLGCCTDLEHCVLSGRGRQFFFSFSFPFFFVCNDALSFLNSSCFVDGTSINNSTEILPLWGTVGFQFNQYCDNNIVPPSHHDGGAACWGAGKFQLLHGEKSDTGRYTVRAYNITSSRIIKDFATDRRPRIGRKNSIIMGSYGIE